MSKPLVGLVGSNIVGITRSVMSTFLRGTGLRFAGIIRGHDLHAPRNSRPRPRAAQMDDTASRANEVGQLFFHADFHGKENANSGLMTPESVDGRKSQVRRDAEGSWPATRKEHKKKIAQSVVSVGSFARLCASSRLTNP
ncbi:MAG: hypothetical protein FJ395_16900 [Verrucomicrobia bacterium]|nr:hypothetical protein [Verrucomicrobiota bacterium]